MSRPAPNAAGEPSLSDALIQAVRGKVPPPVEGVLQKVLALEHLDAVYRGARSMDSSRPFADRVLAHMNVHCRVSQMDLARVPVSGPAVCVANHPFGFIEGVVLASLLRRVRPDVKIMANYLLGSIAEFRDYFILVNPFGSPEAVRSNIRGIKESLSWLEGGGLLVVFPAGEVSHIEWNRPHITDSDWNAGIARLIRNTGSPAVPLFFTGFNGPLFQIAGLVHPLLRTMLLPHEFLNKKNREIEVRIGSAVSAARLAALQSDREVMEFLRERTYLLSRRKPAKKRFLWFPAGSRRRTEVASPQKPDDIDAELRSLPASQLLVDLTEFQVYAAQAPQAPTTLLEIGRLRELTFRGVGEGTGKERDLDSFDRTYWQLILWDKRRKAIAGGYRLGLTDELYARYGLKGIYTQSLFRFNQAFLKKIGPAIELGRSFVSPDYQKTYQPLMLLWKGIGAFLLERPHYRRLFGPVSISSLYLPLSRALMIDFLERHCRDEELARLVKPRVRWHSLELAPWNRMYAAAPHDFEELSTLVEDLEMDQKSAPILLKHYLRLGGKILAFNLDPEFSHALDGLIVVDLLATEPRLLERYMGAAGARHYLSYHGAAAS